MDKLAKELYKSGPVIHADKHGNEYFAFVALIRKGLRYNLMVVDADLVNLQTDPAAYLASEINSYTRMLECPNVSV